MSTVGKPTVITPPCAVRSPRRAAGMPPISTIVEPFAIRSGGPTHTAMSVARAAGKLPMSTVGHPGPLTGPPTCGTGGAPGVTMGHTCMSLSLAAGCPIPKLPSALVDLDHGGCDGNHGSSADIAHFALEVG